MPHHLQRFIDAQELMYTTALAEVRSGRKRSHWMWFIFPQLKGLGHSSAAQHYGISGRAEAQAYLKHPVLGTRLREISNALLQHETLSAAEILRFPDDLKLRSCMTLFAAVDDGDGSIFQKVLDRFFEGEADLKTLAMLRNEAPDQPVAL